MKSAPFSQPASPAFLLTWISLAVVAAIGLISAIAYARGVWIDELWSIWMTRHDLPLGQVAQQRWFRDINPPLFYAVTWLFSPLTGDAIFARRLLNLVWLAYLAGVAALVFWKSPASRRFAPLFVLVLITGKQVADYFPEHRSYALVLCAAGAQLCCFHALLTRPSDISLRGDRVLALAVVVATAVAFNIHFIATFIAACSSGAVFLMLLARRRFRSVGLLTAAGLLAAVPLVWVMAEQAAYVKSGGAPNIFTTTTGEALHVLATVQFWGAFSNLVVVACAAISLLTMTRRGNLASTVMRGGLDFPVAMILALAVGNLAVLLINAVHPFIVERYMLGLVAIAAALTTSLAADLIVSRRWLVILACLNAVAVLALKSNGPMHETRWAEEAAFLQAQVRACPETKVYAVAPDFLPPYIGPPDQPMVHAWGYQEVAGWYGFKATPFDPRKDHALARSSHCPTLLWGEHMHRETTAPALKAAGFIDDPATRTALQGAKLHWGQHESNGFVLEVAPQAAP